jgi:hypothetical protein
MNRIIWGFVVTTTIFSIGHHLDHAFRHHKVGWPFSDHFTGFSVALLFYVGILIGVILTRRGLIGPGFWSILAAVGFVYIVGSHYGPVAEDPPSFYSAEYGSSVKGALALTWLILFLLSLLGAAVYSARRWAMLRQRTPAPSVAQ